MESFDLSKPPYSKEAEMSLLGAIIIDSSVFDDVLLIVDTEDFYEKENREIFETLKEMQNIAMPIDNVTLLDQLKLKGYFDERITRRYVLQLINDVPTAKNAVPYANIVRDKSLLRQLIEVSEEMRGHAQLSDDEAKNVLELAQQRLYDLSTEGKTRGFLSIRDVLVETYNRIVILSKDKNAFLGIQTGFPDLDKKIVGLNDSDLLLVAARPGMGKTSFALNVAQNVALKTGKEVVVFSLEMSAPQLVERMLSSEARIENKKLKTGELTDSEWIGLVDAAGRLSTSNIYIDDSSTSTVLEMKSKCRRFDNLGLIVIDYLQLMRSGAKRSDNRVQEVSEISRSLKIMAKEINVPIICLSQLSRGPESRSDKRPMLSDLRESGAIEQDADMVLFLYREDYYDKETEKRNICECIISKNRHGETAKVELQWNGQYTRFDSIEWKRDDG